MNIFYLDSDPKICAEQHCDKHVVKMIVETAQLLSTAHRLLDGQVSVIMHNDRRKKLWHLSGERDQLYAASHVNHPSALWLRSSEGNYLFLYKLFSHLCDEYTFRYAKKHATCLKLKHLLKVPPKNIPKGPFTEPPPCMPTEFKIENDVIASYRNLYVHSKARFARWTNRRPPSWFIQGIKDYNESNFERTR